MPLLVTSGEPERVAERFGAGRRRRELRHAFAVQAVAERAQEAAAGALEHVDPAALAAVGGGVAPDAVEGAERLQHRVAVLRGPGR